MRLLNIFRPDFSNIKGDVFGGVTAGIVALPLALAFGVQSGLGAPAGLYGAIVIGILAAIFGGTATQVSGPTGPMTVVSAAIVAEAIATAGSLEKGMAIIIPAFALAGIGQILLGVSKVGKYVKYMPHPVVSGFMTGIGLIIIIFQLYPFLGHASEKSAIAVFSNIGDPVSAMNWQAVVMAVGTILIIYLFPKITKAVPSPLVALVAVTGVSVALSFNVPVIGEIPRELPDLQFDAILNLDPEYIWIILEYAGTLAALGAIDSLLTSVVADNITKTHHNSNRELIGQGIGNFFAGIIGGIPGAGATMRTVVNINAGGRTRISGVIHGLLLVLVMLALGPWAALIPKSVLAGILITVGIGIIDYRGLRNLLRIPRTDAAIMIIVLVITVFGSLLHAVGVGIVMAALLFMKKIGDIGEARSEVTDIGAFQAEAPWVDEVETLGQFRKEIFIKHLYGPLFFGITSYFNRMVTELPDVKIVVIRMERVSYIDHSGLYAMEEAVLELERRGIVVVLTGVNGQVLDMLRKLDIVPGLVAEKQVFDTFEDCSAWLQNALSDGENLESTIEEMKSEEET